MDEKRRKKVIIYDTGSIFWCFEDQLYVPPEPKKSDSREKNKAYNEKEIDESR